MKIFLIFLMVICIILSSGMAIAMHKEGKKRLSIINGVTAILCIVCTILMVR